MLYSQIDLRYFIIAINVMVNDGSTMGRGGGRWHDGRVPKGTDKKNWIHLHVTL